jgi:hypothetical protein
VQTGDRELLVVGQVKLLYSKAPEVVDAAYQSLKQVMLAQGKLPKDLLSGCSSAC